MTSLRFTERVAFIPRVRASVTRPWFRWGSEKEREEAELVELYNQAATAYQAWREKDGFADLVRRMPSGDLARQLVCCESYPFGIEADFERLDLKEMVELRKDLRAQLRFLENPERVLGPLLEMITFFVDGLAEELPPLGDSPFTVTLADLYGNDVIDMIFNTFYAHGDRLTELNIFTDLSRQLYLNLCHASGVPPDVEPARPYRTASESKLPPRETAELYLARTPFLEHFETPAALDVPEGNVFLPHALDRRLRGGEDAILGAIHPAPP